MEVFGRQRDNVREKKIVSKPKRITKENPQESDIQILADSLFCLILLGRNFGSVDN